MLDHNKLLELEKRITNLIRYGTVKTVSLTNNRVVVDFNDGGTSPGLPYLVNGSGNAIVYFMPKVGDQVMVISPNGSMTENSVCIPSIYKGDVSGIEDEFRLEFAKGSINYKEGKLTINADTEVDVITKKANVKADEVILSDDSGGGVVCQNHLCALTGTPHPEGSGSVKAKK